MHHRLMIALALVSAGCLSLGGASSMAADAGAGVQQARLSLGDVVDLLNAGVGEPIILRKVEETGTRLQLSVAEILRLKKAGASDALLEALMPDSEPSAEIDTKAVEAAASNSPSFRIYKEVDASGQEVLHITNLDASGKRMGPPAHETSPPIENAYTPRDEDTYAEQEQSGGGQPPVVVNVYQQPAPTQTEQVAPAYTDPYAYLYPGSILPGFYAYGSYGRGYFGGVPSPPGSYSHYLAYHGGKSELYNGALYQRFRSSLHGPHYTFIGPASGRASITQYRAHLRHHR